MRRNLLLIAAVLLSTACCRTESDPILNFLNNRFGMFIHYNMGTIHAEQWAKPNHDPKSFNPQNVDCKQWARGAKSAKMEYAVFTTKHHDGFCLWDSAVTEYDVASSLYRGDIVRQYVDAFRAEGIKVGLYFSVWDRTQGIEKGAVTAADIEYTKAQLTELLTNYGEIECLVIDGWGSIWGKSPTFNDIPYSTLADHIHSLQPNCLVINHSCKTDRSVTQLVHYEATHGQHCPYDNTIPSQQGPTLQPTWFWEAGYETLPLRSLDLILSELNFCNSRYANYLLNAAPNADGRMDENVMQRLKEIGDKWVKPAPLKSLATETKPNAAVRAEASTTAKGFDVRSTLDADLFTVWQPQQGDESPTITLDFGRKKRFNKVVCGAGHNHFDPIEAFQIEAEVDGEWVVIAKRDAAMKVHFEAMFDVEPAQRYRLVITRYKRGKKLPQIGELTFALL